MFAWKWNDIYTKGWLRADPENGRSLALRYYPQPTILLGAQIVMDGLRWTCDDL